MTPYWTSPDCRHVLYCGNCIEVMATLDADSIDACVTDPPYHLTTGKKGGAGDASVNPDSPAGRSRIGTGFMGKAWDGGDVAFQPDTWREVLRVLKPGAYLLAFGGTRTFHRLTCAIEDAGFEIRDCLSWLYGSGFPKSHNGEWGGTALKPAWEPIILARKPLTSTVKANFAIHGTGGLNIDGCRIDGASGNGVWGTSNATVNPDRKFNASPDGTEYRSAKHDLGRWPANLIHDGSDEVVGLFPVNVKGKFGCKAQGKVQFMDKHDQKGSIGGTEDSGSAARFFYCAKASKRDRDEDNNHPTVKPTDLMRYLCRLVTPPGGIVLDPFCGSGSTGKAAILEGFQFIGIEISREYCEIAVERMKRELSQPMLPGLEPEKCEIAAQRLSQEVLAL